MAEKDCRPKKINYVSMADRSALLMVANNERDRLIIRMGFEIGLRTEENLGLILSSHKAKFDNHKGLLELFADLDNYPMKEVFDFVLNGKYTKRGITRTIFFKRDLLVAMKRYHDSERCAAMLSSNQSHDTLFIRLDNEGMGLPICKDQGSNVFTKLRLQCPFINERLSYHDLRHTFATELYHAELANPSGQETRSESAALIVVAERLGHQNITSTIRYIRLRQQMIMIENAPYE
jgi:integrase